MTADIKIVERAEKTMSMHPKKFALWLIMVSITMIFAALTSAYIVRQAGGNWLEFDLPVSMGVTTAIILLSSVTMHWAYISAKRDNVDQVKLAIAITTLLGVAFLIGQLFVWSDLVDDNVYLVGNPSGSFLYILSGMHGLHLVSGLIFLVIVLVSAFQYKVHAKNLTRIQMCATYWHFLDALWIYLFIFLLLNH